MESERNSILMIDGDSAFRSVFGLCLRGEGYSVATATNGGDGFKMAIGRAFDLILLDIMLPDCNGLDICRDFRQAGLTTPILLLTARTQTADKVLGFKLGADAYVTKPFDTAELLARIEALIRRVRLRSLRTTDRAADIRVDVSHARVTRDGRPVDMAAREFRLLHYLVKRSGTCVSREELLKAVWGYPGDSETRTLDVHIASLRQKLEFDPRFPQRILTIPKVGYKFVG